MSFEESARKTAESDLGKQETLQKVKEAIRKTRKEYGEHIFKEDWTKIQYMFDDLLKKLGLEKG